MSTTKNNTAEINGVSDLLHNMNMANNEDSISNTCANCGKEGSDVTNICHKCKSVKYCNAACKKKHRHKHKKQCERRVAELHDEQLFKEPPKDEDCPICFLRSPHLGSGRVYMSCCGKMICRGCRCAVTKRDTACGLCPFCRSPPPMSDAEMIKRYEKRIDVHNDARASYNMGCDYARGESGLPQNHAKALKYWHQAAELGDSKSYYNIAMAYYFGRGMEIDRKKALHYYELAAMGGDADSRHNLGVFEERDGNYHRALKHYMIAVETGDNDSLKTIQQYYMDGRATKEDYAKALRSYQTYLYEIKSDQRDEAAAANDGWKYYESAS